MKRFIILITFCIIFLPLTSSSEIANEQLFVNIKTVDTIININTTTNLSRVIPNYEYIIPITISWNIPATSLKNINAENITIFIKATVESGNEFVYFKDGSKKINVSYIILVCYLDKKSLSESLCSFNSSLTKSINAYVYLNSSKSNEINSTILFSASLTPFEDFIPIYQESLSLKKELDEIKKNANISDPNLESKINKIEEAINTFHIEEARTGITDINLKTGNILGLFSLIPAKINSFLMSLFSFLAPNSEVYIPIVLSIIIIISSLILNLRKGSKYGIMGVAILVLLASIFSLLNQLILILIDLLLIILILSIIYARKNNDKKRFRSGDNYLDLDYEELIKRRNK
ncbi:MAG: hypothetical protein QXW80_01295 [Candidatus Micrarchaeia archaeon]